MQKFIIANGDVVTLTRGLDAQWRDEDGTVYALTDFTAQVDPIVRCGIGPLSLPIDNVLTDGCQAHDYAYSSPTYQLYHTRDDADRMLYRELKLAGKGSAWGLLAGPFYYIARLFGGLFWENEETR